MTNTAVNSPASQLFWTLHDGYSGYQKYYPRSDRNRVPHGRYGFYYVKSGTGYTYTWAATIFGIGIQAETDHSSDTWQEDDWNGGCRSNSNGNGDKITQRNDCLHWAWGSDAPAKVPYTPKIFYNY